MYVFTYRLAVTRVDETVGLSILYKAYQAGGSSILKNFCRIWALQYDASMIEDQAPTDVVTKANKFINCVRFGPLSWWMLAYPNDRYAWSSTYICDFLGMMMCSTIPCYNRAKRS